MLYLHVGLHKTGTTYFQQEVFPRWKGMAYLRSHSIESFLRVPPETKCLVSREGLSGPVIAHQAEKRAFLQRLSRMFPDAQVLISFRRHGSYLNAIYSQYLRYGGTLPLSGFFDLEGDSGFMKREDLRFRAYIEAITEYWGRAPFVFVLSELKENPAGLMADLAALFGTEPPSLDTLARGRRNISLGRPQAELLRRLNAWCGVELHDGSTRPYRVLRRLSLDPPSLCQKWAQSRPGEPIVESGLERRIDAYYDDDWAFVLRCRQGRLERAKADAEAGDSAEKQAGRVRSAQESEAAFETGPARVRPAASA